MSASDGGGWPARARYRVSQFTRGLRSDITSGEASEVRRRLSERELQLFLAAEPRDRRHSVDLFLRLLDEGAQRGREPGEAMLTAALLHDVGKGPLRTWHRVAFVLLNAASPALSRWLEAEGGWAWRRGLWRLRHHAALGAALLREAGSDPRVIEIVAAHTSRPVERDDELGWFVDADDRT